jgi:HK97 family phage major capsid protein
MDELLKQIDEKFSPKFEELTAKAQELGERIGSNTVSDEERQSLQASIERVDSEVKEITAQRDAELRQVEQKALATRIESLEEAIRGASDSSPAFSLSGDVQTEQQKAIYGADSEHSFFIDAKAALRGDPDARERWQTAMGEKAMTEGTGSTGGYLVPDQISNELLELRSAQTVLRPLFSKLQVSSDTLRIPSITGGLTAGWVAELAEKPVSDLTFGEISVNVFTKAGLAVASNQLLADAKQSVDRLVYRDLAKRLAIVEEVALINGTGTGQPTGILNTAGIQTEATTAATQLAVLDNILNAITKIYTNYFGAPNAIVMHPRTWAWLIAARESGTSGNYLLASPGSADPRQADESLPGYGQGALPRGSIFGFPVYTTVNVPTTLGGGTESRIIVGNFSEGLILDRQGVTLDASEHVYFTSNQTVFRAEDRMGFTAARYPKAFCVVQGAHLAGV